MTVQVCLCRTWSETQIVGFVTRMLIMEVLIYKLFMLGLRNKQMSRLVGKPTMWFPKRSDTNRPVQAQKRARSLKFRISVEEELYYPSSENKGADQLRGYREADLRLCFRLCRMLVFTMRRLKCSLNMYKEIRLCSLAT